MNTIKINHIIPNDTSSERKEKHDSIDERSEEMKNRQIETETNNNKNNINNKNIMTNNYCIEPNIYVKTDKTNNTQDKKIKKISNKEQKCTCTCEKCCKRTFIILFSLLILIIEFIFNFLEAFIFIYYKNNCKQCKAELYEKINKILSFYLAIFIILFIMICIGVTINLTKRLFLFTSGLEPTFYIILIGLLVVMFVLQLINLIYVQKDYSNTKTWEDCGNFEGWMKFWLISNYVEISIYIIKVLLKNNKNIKFFTFIEADNIIYNCFL